jgi:hypothetical protein
VQKLKEMIENKRISREDATRLLMLYALRYENSSGAELVNLMNLLSKTGATPEQLRVRLPLMPVYALICV